MEVFEVKYEEGVGNNRIDSPTLYLTKSNGTILMGFCSLSRIQDWGLERRPSK